MKVLGFIPLAVCFLASSVICAAQDDPQDEINRVKLDTAYLYSSGTSMVSEQEALEMASDLLLVEVGEWLKDRNVSAGVDGYVLRAKEKKEIITTRRGNLFRVFVYVNKNEVVSFEKDEKVIVIGRRDPSDFEKEILAVEDFNGMNSFLSANCQSGVIKNYGKLSSCPLEGKVYVLLFDRVGTIMARALVSGNLIVNLSTGENDSFDNYKGCNGIWFTIE